MPQIFIIHERLSKSQARELANELIPIVELEFGIQNTNDTACTIVGGETTINEAHVQVEIRYTAGHDEYGWGRPFDPTVEDQDRLADAIKQAFDKFLLRECGATVLSLSVWCKPFYNSHFKMWKK